MSYPDAGVFILFGLFCTAVCIAIELRAIRKALQARWDYEIFNVKRMISTDSASRLLDTVRDSFCQNATRE